MIRKKKQIYQKYSIILNIFFIGFYLWYFFFHVGIGYYIDKYIYKKELFLKDTYYNAKVQSFKEINLAINKDKEYIMFIGDSLIEQFPVCYFFSKKSILNRGIGNDTTNGILKRLEKNVNNVKIGKCFLMIGHNDLKYRSVEKTYSNIVKILDGIKAKEKYFISILPSNNAEINCEKKILNKKIERFCKKNDINYIDIFMKFLNNNSINEAYYYDGVHLNISGYRVIYKELEKLI